MYIYHSFVVPDERRQEQRWGDGVQREIRRLALCVCVCMCYCSYPGKDSDEQIQDVSYILDNLADKKQDTHHMTRPPVKETVVSSAEVLTLW